MIFIYDDGIHNNAGVMMAVQSAIPDIECRFCNAAMIIEEHCLDSAKLLIMPGGADLYFCERLNGIGNQKIKAFVENGGSYLGLCAGAYYACSSLDWNNGEIDGPRELAFYDGIATGPIFDWVEKPQNIYEGSWIKAVKIKTETGDEFMTYYNGGPILSEPRDNKTMVIARYTDLDNTPPAIIQGQYGKGQYILSSPHIEIFGDAVIERLYRHQNKSFQYETDVAKILAKHTKQQNHFFNVLMQGLT